MPRFLPKSEKLRQLEPHLESIFRDLFGLSQSEKMQCFNMGQRGLSGYFPFHYEVTHPSFGVENKEFWQICRMGNIPPADQNFYPQNAWPASKANSFEKLANLYLELDATVNELIKIYCHEFDIPEEYLRSDPGNHVMRLVHYPSAEHPVAVPEHQDTTLFTLSLWNNQAGMELPSQSTWNELNPTENEFAVIEGLILERISGGRIPATPHRVRTPVSGRPRFSLLYFVHPPPKFMIRSLPDQKGEIAPEILCSQWLKAHTLELGIRKDLHKPF